MFDRGWYCRDVAVVRTPDVLIAACNSADPRRDRWLSATAAALSPDEQTRQAAIADLRQMGFAAHTAAPHPEKQQRRWGWWHTQAMIGTVFAAAACSGFFDAQGRRLCEGPTATGGRCRNPAGCRIDHKAIVAEGPTLIAEAVTFPAGLAPERAAARIADWANAPSAGPQGASRAARVLSSADVGVLPSGGARSANLVSGITDFLKARPWGFTFDPADPYDPADDSEGPLSGISVAFDNTKLEWDPQQAAVDFPGGEPTFDASAKINAWVKSFADALDNGRCWLGGWRADDGTVEINVTFVFKPEHEQAAMEFGALQDQEAVHRLDDHEDLETGGAGGASAAEAAEAQHEIETADAYLRSLTSGDTP